MALAVPAASADTDGGAEPLGTAADLGVDVPSASAELTSEFASSPTGAWFVELAPRPTVQGGSSAAIQRAGRDVVAEAAAAGVDLDVRHTFGSLWSGISANIDDDDVELVRQLRSEEHTSELQSRGHLVCRLLLEKK